MIGALAGDIIGSPFERRDRRIKTKDFPLFSAKSRLTDDSILTIAVAESVLKSVDYGKIFQRYAKRFPKAGYGSMFIEWSKSKSPEPYKSWGNGSAMRVSPIAWAFNNLETVLDEAKKSSVVTHDHPEAVTGAQATAAAVFFARKGIPKPVILSRLERMFGYDLQFTLDEIRSSYEFTASCSGTVPPAIRCFLEGESFEDTVRNAVSLGGDSDTLASIAGSIADAYYGVPSDIIEETSRKVSKYPTLARIVINFLSKYYGKS
jgi:ADP-ribosylglycohydrolase